MNTSLIRNQHLKLRYINIFGNIEALITLYSLQANSVDAEICGPL